MKKQEYLLHLATTTNILWKLIKTNGLDPDDMFSKAGINPDLLNKPQARISCSKINNLWETATQKIDAPCFAIHAGEHWHPSYLNALGYAWLVSTNLKESFDKLAQYSRVLSDSAQVLLKTNQDESTLIFKYHPDSPHHPAQRVSTLSILIEMCRINCGTDLNPTMVQFVGEYPLCVDAYTEYFKSDVIFAAEYDSMTFSNEDVYRPLPSANSHLAEINDQVIVNYLAELDKNDIIQQTKLKITDMLSSGNITDDIVAKRLNMSTRSLQRHLQKKRTTFRSVLDKTREDLARGYMKDSSMRLEEIAFLTGFSQYSSFSRAFKRWTGRSPSEIRASSNTN